jgi:hypothetical protein
MNRQLKKRLQKRLRSNNWFEIIQGSWANVQLPDSYGGSNFFINCSELRDESSYLIKFSFVVAGSSN